MYQALYRKYRPQTFDDVVGQAGITQTLKHQLQSGKLSHAYLFTGSRGTGKTSCAKILAKAVNCLHPEDGNPCNECASCRSIDAGVCMDVLEIDAASNNGVDNVRALREDAVFPPAEVKKRVYIIDEVHMLSISAFNALLKTIEEPPDHLLFILATTELHKVPVTILSRCQRFSFRRLLPEDIALRIGECAYREGIAITPEAISLLSRLADGAMRDGMSLLDQCASGAAGTLDVDTVNRVLGLAGSQTVCAMLEAVADRDSDTLLKLFSQEYAAGKDLAAMVDELTGLCRDLLLLKTTKTTALCSGSVDPSTLTALAERFTAPNLLRMTSQLQATAAGFTRSSNGRIDVELCLLQLCDEALTVDYQSLNARLSRLEAGLPSVPKQKPVPAEEPKAEPEAKPVLPPDAFFEKLCSLVKPDIPPDLRFYFDKSQPSFLQGRLENRILKILVPTAFEIRRLEKVKSLLETTASQLAGSSIRVVVTANAPTVPDLMEQFSRVAQEHPDTFHIKE